MTTEEQLEEERREAIEYQNALLDIRAILQTKPGVRFFGYLFKTLSVGEFPALGMEGNLLHDYLGYMRSGNEIFKLATQADAEIAGQILASVNKEKYAKLSKK